jgi:hypothetical protein
MLQAMGALDPYNSEIAIVNDDMNCGRDTKLNYDNVGDLHDGIDPEH